MDLISFRFTISLPLTKFVSQYSEISKPSNHIFREDLPDDELEQIMKNFEDGDVSIKESVLDRYGKLCKNFETTESRFINGIEIFSQALYMNVGESKVDAAQLYLRSLLKYHRDLVKYEFSSFIFNLKYIQIVTQAQ